jgi:DNA modification methylase
MVAANKIGRRCIGIDLNPDYRELACSRLSVLGFEDYEYIVGDSKYELARIGLVDYIVTSPPYHNILRNGSKGTRNHNGKLYRMAAREGIEYYSEHNNDLGNFDEYADYIIALRDIMAKAFDKLRDGRYCSIIISDFTVNKIEVCVQADIVRLMQDIGFTFCGTTILLQPVKPLYPFGYPYAFKINHHHQNMMHFQKPKSISTHAENNDS